MSAARRSPPSYRMALEWIALEDDTDFLDDGDDAPMSVTLSMVADLFDRTESEAKRDLRATLARGARAVAKMKGAQS